MGFRFSLFMETVQQIQWSDLKKSSNCFSIAITSCNLNCLVYPIFCFVLLFFCCATLSCHFFGLCCCVVYSVSSRERFVSSRIPILLAVPPIPPQIHTFTHFPKLSSCFHTPNKSFLLLQRLKHDSETWQLIAALQM